MIKYFKYLYYIFRHKWYVFIECCKLGIPIHGLLHDISKFLPGEFIPYANYFYGIKNQKSFDMAWLLHQKRSRHHWQWWMLPEDSPGEEFTLQEPGQGYEIYLCRNNRPLAMFDESVLRDEDKKVPNMCNSNAYLYAKEIRNRLNRKAKILPMPDSYRKEMLADWRGAGMAQGKSDTKAWYLANKDKMQLHPETREWIESKLQNDF